MRILLYLSIIYPKISPDIFSTLLRFSLFFSQGILLKKLNLSFPDVLTGNPISLKNGYPIKTFEYDKTDDISKERGN